MILQGNQRGGARDLALHLLKADNDHVEVHELRGFMSDDLESALKETHIISRGTRAKQFLYSLSLNPPKNEKVSTKAFEAAIEKVESKLGLTNQPRAVIMHDKQGRRHCHAVWSRIDAQEMKAIHLPHTKLKLKEVSRELYLEHGWQMPEGFIDRRNRDPRNFTLQQWQQAKRLGKDPRTIKQALQDCWALSDDLASFETALKERGYALAKGDRRGFVVMDRACEIFSVSKKWVGVNAKTVREKLGDSTKLPSVEQTRSAIAKDMHTHLQGLKTAQTGALKSRSKLIQGRLDALIAKQKQERENQGSALEQRWQLETQQRQARYSHGIKGLVDRLTGERSRLQKQNERETLSAYQRDRRLKDELIYKHLEQRRTIEQRAERLEQFKQKHGPKLKKDIQQYREVMDKKREKFDRIRPRSKTNGPSLER